jgi:hypothetical protein
MTVFGEGGRITSRRVNMQKWEYLEVRTDSAAAEKPGYRTSDGRQGRLSWINTMDEKGRSFPLYVALAPLLSELGSEGWELVAFRDELNLILKRPLAG